MGRSQRHNLWEHGATAAGEIHAEGVVAPGIAMQVDPSNPNVLVAGPGLLNGGLEWKEPPDLSEVEVPVGDPGGPLAGSTLTGAIPEELATQPEPPVGPDPAPGEEPTLTSIDPATAELGSADFTLHCIGTNFTETSVIYFAGQSEPATFVSPTELTTIVKPSLGWGAVTVPVWVQQGSVQTPALDFTFTEAAAGSGARTFPTGPIALLLVEDDPAGIALTVAPGADIRVGDTLLVEASFDSSVNGSWDVISVNGDRVVVDNGYILAAPIENKGRVTITAGS